MIHVQNRWTFKQEWMEYINQEQMKYSTRLKTNTTLSWICSNSNYYEFNLVYSNLIRKKICSLGKIRWSTLVYSYFLGISIIEFIIQHIFPNITINVRCYTLYKFDQSWKVSTNKNKLELISVFFLKLFLERRQWSLLVDAFSSKRSSIPPSSRDGAIIS